MNDAVEADQLRLFVERLERLLEEKKGLSEDIRDVMSEAKGQGYHTATIREILKLRRMEKNDRDERAALLEIYQYALGLA